MTQEARTRGGARVDGHPPSGAGRARRAALGGVVLLGAGWFFVGCAARTWRGLEVVPASQAARILEGHVQTALHGGPRQVVFRWEAREPGLRVRGRGVVRMEAPSRLRLDLFSPQGETLFQGALADEELRIPSWAPRELAPPPTFLWAALGVVRPGEGWALVGGERGRGEAFMFRFDVGDDREARFWFDRGRLLRVEGRVRGGVEEEVELRWNDSWQVPIRTVYRNLREFRELVFNLESERAVDAFPAHIWYPGR